MQISFLNILISIEKSVREQSVLFVDSENVRFHAEQQNPDFTDYPGLFNKLDITVDKKILYFAKLPKQASQSVRQKQADRIQMYRKNRYETKRSGVVQWDSKREVLGNEKGVDVQIALDIVACARKGARCIYLASSDSDLLPAIRQAQRYGVPVCYIFFEGRENRGVLQSCGRYVKIPISYL